MVKIVIVGARGRMGQNILRLVGEDKEIECVGEVDLGDDLRSSLKNADCLIDFTSAQAAVENIEIALELKKPAVVGTTGFSDEERAKIEQASRTIPIVLSPNMSVGVNLLFGIVGGIARKLGDSYDIKITEVHHTKKKDAPSGTAKKLAQELEKVGRKAPISSIRTGEVVGDHTVIYASPSETIELTHRAHSRDAFAAGALKAAKWIKGKDAGLYTMREVLGV